MLKKKKKNYNYRMGNICDFCFNSKTIPKWDHYDVWCKLRKIKVSQKGTCDEYKD